MLLEWLINLMNNHLFYESVVNQRKLDLNFHKVLFPNEFFQSSSPYLYDLIVNNYHQERIAAGYKYSYTEALTNVWTQNIGQK